jgi:Mg-chelatase subunit ChlD
LQLPAPTWARFLRFVARNDQPDGGWGYLPEQISVYEGQEHGSVVAAWGQNSSMGPMEAALPPALPVPLARPENTTREAAIAIGNDPLDSNVRLGKYDNWYRLSVSNGENHIAVSLQGYPTIEATAELLDVSGKTVGWSSREVIVERAQYEAYVEPGDYWIKVSEPRRSVVFTWDTSGSTAAVRPIIRQAMMRYVEDLTPELDEAHMLPFGGKFLSQRWLSQPYMLQSVLNDYNGAGDSSAAETALVQAANKLRNREGKKIIVVITDAATSSDSLLWQTLAEVRPRIIALGVSSRGAFSSYPPREQDLLQDWAFSSGGYYEYVENVGAVARAFDRASTRIRQPAEYRIAAEAGFREKPAPGSLQVLLQPSKSADITLQAPAIEVILDASGSMLQRLDGKRRYIIARDVLRDMVENSLPDGASFGLRVFGHKEAGSCRTDLEIPVSPLNKASVVAKIRAIQPKNLAKTPIADSIAAVAGDLRGSKGPKTVIVITDGEETCDGDVPAALEKLGKSGIDAVVNIVGFAIDDEALESRFRAWATLGGGEYHHASDQARLESGVRELVALRFRIEDAAGDLHGPYPVGEEAIELPPGEYTVHLADGERHSVTISPGSKTVVNVAYK